MKYTIYHDKNPTYGFRNHPEFNEVNFEKVAEVECQSLGTIFRVTNHISAPWFGNPEVKWCKKDSRSTSIGDVVTDEDGKKFRCEMVGWTELK